MKMSIRFPDPPAGPATRRAIYEYCREAGIPTSLRTIEKWPLPYRVMGNKAVSDWNVVIAFLDDRFNSAPVHHAGTLRRLARKLPPA